MTLFKTLLLWTVILSACWAFLHRDESRFGFTGQTFEATGDRAYRHVAGVFESIDDATRSLGVPKRQPRFDKI